MNEDKLWSNAVSAARVIQSLGYIDERAVDIIAKVILAHFQSGSLKEPDLGYKPEDLRYEVLKAPSIDEHLIDNTLDPSRVVKGRSYWLTAGQRAYLRDTYGMTPARTVTLTEVAFYPNTRFLYQITISSDEHVTEERRRHVLTRAVLNANAFFQGSAQRDAEIAEGKSTAQVTAVREKTTKVISQLNQYLKDLGDL